MPADLPPALQKPRNWHVHYAPAEKKGYSGVGLLSRRAPDAVETSLGESRFDREGRLQIARFGRLVVVNGYIPAASFIVNDSLAPNHLWLNQHDGTFVRVSEERSGMADTGAGRGVSPCDVNRDGWMDFYLMNNGAFRVSAVNDQCRLFINQMGKLYPSRSWAQFDLHGWKRRVNVFVKSWGIWPTTPHTTGRTNTRTVNTRRKYASIGAC